LQDNDAHFRFAPEAIQSTNPQEVVEWHGSQ
jgi:hypothetical protein